MKIVEEYAQMKVDEDRKQTVIRMFKKGFSVDEIVDTTEYALSFVEETLFN